MNNEFALDVKKGLTAKNKYIPDRQYYDDRGSIYFQELMVNEYYYPTNSEYEIFENYKSEICKIFTYNNKKIQLIEFGAGDGYKTKILIKELIKLNSIFTYYPIDYSEKYLIELKSNFSKTFPELRLKYINKDYFAALKDFKNNNDNYRKIIFFIGSSFGGLTPDESNSFLDSLHKLISNDDMVLFGIDLKKSPTVLRKAYHETCKNWCFYLLNRINTELGGNINLNNFEYYTNYDPVTGEYKWYFLSKINQVINITKINLDVELEKWEPIYFSKSKKFSEKEIAEILDNHNFKIINQFFDKKNYFTNIIFTKK